MIKKQPTKLTPEEIAEELAFLDLKLRNVQTYMDIPDFFLPGEGRPEKLSEKPIDRALLAV